MMEKRSRISGSAGISVTHLALNAVVAMIILDGMVSDGSKCSYIFGQAHASQWQAESTLSYERRGKDTINPFANGGVENTKRMRDRCGRYSLLRVLQQWENLQKRCRLTLRDNYLQDERDRYEYSMSSGPPSPTNVDEMTIGKRSRHHFYSAINYPEADKDNQYRNYYYEVNGDALESCCPVVFEVIAPIYGRNRSGHMVELYKDENVQQKFYEYRCRKDYLEQPCRYVDGHHRKISKCVQQYLDTYALVRSDTSATGWSMEHIRVASGCACKVDPVKASRRRKKVSTSRNIDLLLSSSSSQNQRQRSKAKRRELNFRSSIVDY